MGESTLTRLKVKDIEYTTQFFESNSAIAFIKDLTFDRCDVGINDCGIYCFYDGKGNPLYVGQSKNLISRVSHHLKYSIHPMAKIKPLISSVRFLVINKEEYSQAKLMKIEERFIRNINPLFNGSNTRGLSNLRSFIDSCHIDTPVSVIKDKIAEFTGVGTDEKQIHEKEEGECMQDSKELFSVKEAIKLAIKHEEETKADEIIDGLLKMVRQTSTAS